jgi:hypothetical protein
VREGRCWALVQIADDEASTFGESHEIPVDLSTLPNPLRMIVENDHGNYPHSDLTDVLTGRKSIREAFGLQDKMQVKRMTATGNVRLPNAS